MIEDRLTGERSVVEDTVKNITGVISFQNFRVQSSLSFLNVSLAIVFIVTLKVFTSKHWNANSSRFLVTKQYFTHYPSLRIVRAG